MVSLRIKNHLKVDCSIGIRQTIQSDQESHSLSGPETTVEDQEGIDTDTVVFPKNDQNNQVCCSDLLKDIPNWSQTGKRGREKTVAEKTDDKIYNVMPLSVYYGYGPEVPHTQRRLEGLLMSSSDQSLFARKKQKTDESEYIDADSYKIDSQSALELLGNMSKITTGRMNPKRAKAVKSEHRCEICGKTFQSGQALGGHKTYHRVKPVVDPFRGEFVRRIPKKQLSLSGRDNHVQVRDFMTSMLLPMGLSGKAGSISEDSYQQHPKRLLDFDLNIPYVG